MKNRTHRYLGTFVNNAEGNSSYKLMVKNVRNTVTGGRFVKMYRGNSRQVKVWSHGHGPGCRLPNGTSKKLGATHFDVYLLSRMDSNTGYRRSDPKFFNFTLG